MEQESVGVGPHPTPWPNGSEYDRGMLENGDRRNVLDKYRYWSTAAIKADLDVSRLPLEIAVENLSRDFNMGTIVRNANAFNVRSVHIIGRKQWNRRGAMVTDLYMNIFYYPDVSSFIQSMRQRNKQVLAIDIVAGSKPLSEVSLPLDAVMVFGAEGPGLSNELRTEADAVIHIEQFGSTRSVNVGVASGIAMYAWMQKHALTHQI